VDHRFKIFDRKTEEFFNNGKSLTVIDCIECSSFCTAADEFSSILLVSEKKDVNGALIAQGDLIEVIWEKQPTGFGKFEVVFERCAFRLKEIEKNWAIVLQDNNCLSDFEEIKIIGNIFEKTVDNSSNP